MLNEARINQLLDELDVALAINDTAVRYAIECGLEVEELEANVLNAHAFTGKNAEARKLEGIALLADNPDVNEARHAKMEGDEALSKSRNRLELARTAVKLWIAFANQTATR